MEGGVENAEYRECGVWKLRSVQTQSLKNEECIENMRECGRCIVRKISSVEKLAVASETFMY